MYSYMKSAATGAAVIGSHFIQPIGILQEFLKRTFFTWISLWHSVPTSTNVLDKASMGTIGLFDSIDEYGHDQWFVGLGFGFGVIIHLLFYHGPKPTVSRRVVGKLATTAYYYSKEMMGHGNSQKQGGGIPLQRLHAYRQYCIAATT